MTSPRPYTPETRSVPLTLLDVPFPFIMIRSGSLWCLVWALFLLYVSAMVPAFAFYGVMATIVIAAGGVYLGMKELGEEW